MSLQSVPVSKCLDKKLKMFGLELPDLLAVFILLSLLNYLFGQSSQKFLLIWAPTLLLAAILRIGKTNKPENYIIHWIRFQTKPGVYSAFTEPTKWASPFFYKRSPR